MMDTPAPVIALVAGEASGDQLGAALVASLRRRHPHARFVGVGGDRMAAAGVDCWWDAQELAVMGLFEVLGHFPRLLAIRRELKRRLTALRPDVFVGIDAPDFNLGLEIALRRSGIRTVHYVSPTVWAWRPGRVRKIARAADLVLCLFPFEPDFYSGHGVAASYVGHPLADQIEADRDPAAARAALGLDRSATTITLLPGSRVTEVSLLAAPMIEAVRQLQARRPELQVVLAAAGERVERVIGQVLQAAGYTGALLLRGQAVQAMAAADVVLCASGTATLEAMLVNRPMVMAYRIARTTYFAARYLHLIRPQLFALPNILAGEELVPELIQDDVRPERLAREAQVWLDDPERCARLTGRFDQLHAALRCSAGDRAAAAVAGVMGDAAA